MASDEPLVVVYQATNVKNGKRYIGVTKRGLRARRNSHRNSARTGTGLFQRAIRKYGIDGFRFEVLFDFQDDYDLAKVYEWEMISKHRPEYNLAAGGEGGVAHVLTRARLSAAHKGKKRSIEARARMSAAQRIRAVEFPVDEETRAKMRAAKLGRKHAPEVVARRAAAGYRPSAETRAKMSAAQTGRPPTKGRTGQPVPQETREKIRQTLKNATWVDTPARIASRTRTGVRAAHEARKIPVRCVEDGNVFETIKAAAQFYGLNQMKLGAAIRAGKPYRGHTFERLPKA